MAQTFELSTQFDVVVNFAVKDKTGTAYWFQHGLVTGSSKIKDGQASVSKQNPWCYEYAAVIWPTVGKQVQRRAKTVGILRSMSAEPPQDAAHQ